MLRNPKYATPDGVMVDIEMNHDEFGWIPFTASPDDIEQHGRDIYAAVIAGEYGPIAAYDGPDETEMLAQAVRTRRDQLLAGVDLVVSNPLRWAGMSETEQQSWADYRQALLDVPQQDGFPHEVDWPDIPDTATNQPAA